MSHEPLNERVLQIIDEFENRASVIGSHPAAREIAVALDRTERGQAQAEASLAALRQALQQVDDALIDGSIDDVAHFRDLIGTVLAAWNGEHATATVTATTHYRIDVQLVRIVSEPFFMESDQKRFSVSLDGRDPLEEIDVLRIFIRQMRQLNVIP